jgi:hypothetical protein
VNAGCSADARYFVYLNNQRPLGRTPAFAPYFKQSIMAVLMLKEFEKLEALLYRSQPSERDPQVDRDEAAKLAARWGWLAHRLRKAAVELPQIRPPDRGALGTR